MNIVKNLTLLLIFLFLFSCNKSSETVDSGPLEKAKYINTEYLKKWTYKRTENKESWKHPNANITFSIETINLDHKFTDSKSAGIIADNIIRSKAKLFQKNAEEKINPMTSPNTYSRLKYKHDYSYWIDKKRYISGFLYLFKKKYTLITLDIDKTQPVDFSVVLFWNSIDLKL